MTAANTSEKVEEILKHIFKSLGYLIAYESNHSVLNFILKITDESNHSHEDIPTLLKRHKKLN